ncbi:MAG: type II toxin-antitoxin system VapC family toxin [Treponema sp.]|nr:type II toxin-antitoxin system VapC family toxin [Treponema sp.]
MKYLLDTHALLWYAQGSAELSLTAKSIMETEECLYTMASLWEIAIKQKLGKLDNSLSILELKSFCRDAGFIFLPTRAEYVEVTKSLPFIHRDPFDRLLISCAQCEGVTIITCDGKIPPYGVRTVW